MRTTTRLAAAVRGAVRGAIVWPVANVPPATKDAMPEVDAGGFLDEVGFGEVGPFAPELRIPALVIVGDRDVSFCSSLGCPEAQAERESYPNVSDYQVTVRERQGHGLNLHQRARETTMQIAGWLYQHSS
jgi:pimeloyl-ACP methyl ester carboxylesterase